MSFGRSQRDQILPQCNKIF